MARRGGWGVTDTTVHTLYGGKGNLLMLSSKFILFLLHEDVLSIPWAPHRIAGTECKNTNYNITRKVIILSTRADNWRPAAWDSMHSVSGSQPAKVESSRTDVAPEIRFLALVSVSPRSKSHLMFSLFIYVSFHMAKQESGSRRQMKNVNWINL